MANAAKLSSNSPARVLLIGYPGAGKTGALCSLVDAGLKLRILSYDMAANMQPLFQYVQDKEKLANVDIVFLEDKLRGGAKFVEPVGIPTAFADGLKMMDRWRYKEGEEEIDLGASKDWGPDTVVVLDSLTAMGECAKRRAMVMLNKTPLNSTQQMWGLAMQDQHAFLSKLVSSSNKFHVVVLAHLKEVGPKDITSGDSEVTKEIKERLVNLMPTRIYPSALGQQLPREVGALFSTVLLCEREYKANKVTRVLKAMSGPEIDLKLPAKNLPDRLPQESGLLEVFKAVTGGNWFDVATEGEVHV